jgi:hypothetical protein
MKQKQFIFYNIKGFGMLIFEIIYNNLTPTNVNVMSIIIVSAFEKEVIK